MHHTACQRGAV